MNSREGECVVRPRPRPPDHTMCPPQQPPPQLLWRPVARECGSHEHTETITSTISECAPHDGGGRPHAESGARHLSAFLFFRRVSSAPHVMAATHTPTPICLASEHGLPSSLPVAFGGIVLLKSLFIFSLHRKDWVCLKSPAGISHLGSFITLGMISPSQESDTSARFGRTGRCAPAPNSHGHRPRARTSRPGAPPGGVGVNWVEEKNQAPPPS